MSLLRLIDEAQAAGARMERCCEELGLDPRTVQRWRNGGIGDDGRHGPKNKLPASERAHALRVMNSAEFRDKSPNQIVPTLADRGEYVASEATMFRILREEGQAAHRGPAKPPTSRPPSECALPARTKSGVGTLPTCGRRSPGRFSTCTSSSLVWSRQIVGFRVEAKECTALASELLEEICQKRGLDPQGIVLHQDNGSPMKGATLRTTMERLGVVASFSRPHVKGTQSREVGRRYQGLGIPERSLPQPIP